MKNIPNEKNDESIEPPSQYFSQVFCKEAGVILGSQKSKMAMSYGMQNKGFPPQFNPGTTQPNQQGT